MEEDYKKIRDKKYKADSKERLSKILKKKIQTTMIGALSSMEENLRFLWEQDSPKVSKAQMKEIYNKIRSEILDRGNNQARNVDAELAQYEVEWLRYSMQIPVIQNPKN
jgi:CRISPR/Cas system CSM-associated protein Csm2 small subunit